MTTSQIIVFMDSVGQVRAEAPGWNGHRVKVNLEADFLDRNPELRAELIAQQDRAKRVASAMAPQIERRDPELDRRERNAEIARQRVIDDQKWLDSLSESAREHELAKREEKRLAIIEAENARARDLYRRTAKNHGTNLADRVIADPSRRPNQRIVISVNQNGAKVTYNPRFDSEPKTEGQKRAKKVSEKFNLDLEI